MRATPALLDTTCWTGTVAPTAPEQRLSLEQPEREAVTMSGTRDLDTLLATMNPELSDIEVVFCTAPDLPLADALTLSPAGVFAEREGLSLIIEKSTAETRGLPFDTVLKAIALTVHSSLEAVGLTAVVAGRLARHGISANVVAAYHHDYIFVPVADARSALSIYCVYYRQKLRQTVLGRYPKAIALG